MVNLAAGADNCLLAGLVSPLKARKDEAIGVLTNGGRHRLGKRVERREDGLGELVNKINVRFQPKVNLEGGVSVKKKKSDAHKKVRP